MLHETIPRETYPCKDVVYRFIIENDAGAEYYGIDFIDTLPEQLVVLQVLGDALGGQVVAVPESNIIYIRDMHLPLGRDTLEVLVEVGDIAPGSYPNRAIIRNFPVVLGPVRWSDDPATQENDSTVLTVLGVERDTLVVEEIVCEGNSLVLDGRPYGLEFQWDHGFSSATREVDEPGIYELVAFDGCNPSYIFFDVVPGDLIDVFFTDERLLISLGDSIDLMPQLYNTGDTAIVQWSDPWGKSILCADCLITRAGPLNSTQYKIYVMNETCSDSAEIQIDVDNSRQFFAPNVFSPNNDGINDYFYLQSRQFAIIESFTIADRWNNVVFHTTAHEMNNQSSGWDGTRGGQPLAPGAYVWQAKMTFLDMKTEYYGGQVLLVR